MKESSMHNSFFVAILLVNPAAAFEVCVESGHLTDCDGVTPYGWDSYPEINIHPPILSTSISKTCDGDPLFGASYVRHDDSNPQWKMCCEYGGPVMSVDVKIIDHEFTKNHEMTVMHFTREEIPEGTGSVFRKFSPVDTKVTELIMESMDLDLQVPLVGDIDIWKQLLRSNTGCTLGNATMTFTNQHGQTGLDATVGASTRPP